MGWVSRALGLNTEVVGVFKPPITMFGSPRNLINDMHEVVLISLIDLNCNKKLLTITFRV